MNVEGGRREGGRGVGGREGWEGVDGPKGEGRGEWTGRGREGKKCPRGMKGREANLLGKVRSGLYGTRGEKT